MHLGINSRVLKVQYTFIGFLFVVASCAQESKNIKIIDYKTEYKFSSQIEEKVTKDTVPWKYQISAADYATKGDYKNALTHWDLAFNNKPKKYTKSEIDSVNNQYIKKDAVDYIITKAKDHRILIINEAHHNSFHRKFTSSLLKELFDQGYKNLGLEALGNGEYKDSTLQHRAYPILATGHYTKDPQFGNLIREALSIGYNVFPYEDTTDSNGKKREIEQAKNIHKVIKEKPNEKFLIHCGFAHVLEGPYKSWEKAMAERLKEYTGIDPLTIDQTRYSEKSKLVFSAPLLNAFDIQQSSVLIQKDNNMPMKYERGEAYADMAILHPNTNYVDGRPSWIFKDAFKKVSISLADVKIDFPVLVFAFKQGEDINLAVPIDIAEINTSSETCHLGLKKGTYDVVVTNGKESLKFERKVVR